MSLIAGDPLTQVAFSIYENKGVYALFVGSGVSRSADIPTGWEITLDLVRRVAAVQGVEDQPDWAAWYKLKTGREPNYSELVGELGLSRDERRSILHSYIEPTATDREEGRKLPTKAHHAIASLVREQYVKVIITTNFDRLIENALREQGVEPTVITSVDDLKGAEPLAHTSCYLFKIHGDYKDARILNTDDELTAYPAAYDALLDRIIDEHGLIICGWSGEWDHALRAALLRAPARRYSMFWAARGNLSDGAMKILKQRHAKIVKISDADEFFGEIERRVQVLTRTSQLNPQSVELLVNSTKRYLTKPEYRIQLDELFSSEMQNLIDKLNTASFVASRQFDKEEFRRRIEIYESIAEPLVRMAGVLGRWGDGSQQRLILDVIRMLCSHADQESGGLVVWLNIRNYPAVLVMSGYCLGLVRSERWAELHELFTTRLGERNSVETKRIVEMLFLLSWSGGDNEYWKNLEGHERRKTALSDHLCALLSTWGKSFIGVLPEFEQLYETWEILGSLAYLERAEIAEIDAELSQPSRNGFVWFPIGRSGWHERTRERIIDELLHDEMRASLVRAGFGKGNDDSLQKFITNYRRLAARVMYS